VSLHSYDKISFRLTPVSGDTNYKNCAVQAGTWTSFQSPDADRTNNITTYVGGAQNITEGTFYDMVFDIAKFKAYGLNLTGTFPMAVVINCGAASYTVSDFKIWQGK
jgi:hypothetical protein